MEIHWYVIATIWISLGQFIILRAVVKKTDWKSLIPFLRKETIYTLESKLLSFDEAVNAKFITDEDGTITSINTAAEKLFYYKKIELIGKPITTIIPERDVHKIKGMFAAEKGNEMEEKQSSLTVVTKYKNEIVVEYLLRKKKLEEGFFYLAIFSDRAREHAKIKKYEQVIALQKIKIEILNKGEEISGSGSWLWELGAKNEMTVSEGYRNILGIGKEDKYDAVEIKKRVWDDDMHIVDAALKKAFEGQPYEIQYRMKRVSDFKLIYINSKVRPYKDADGVVTHLHGSTRLLQTLNLVYKENEGE